jgi:hypothetical protein
MSEQASLGREERRVRALAKASGYALEKSRGHENAGTFNLTDDGGTRFAIYGLSLDQAENWINAIPLDEAIRLDKETSAAQDAVWAQLEAAQREVTRLEELDDQIVYPLNPAAVLASYSRDPSHATNGRKTRVDA